MADGNVVLFPDLYTDTHGIQTLNATKTQLDKHKRAQPPLSHRDKRSETRTRLVLDSELGIVKGNKAYDARSAMNMTTRLEVQPQRWRQEDKKKSSNNFFKDK